MTTPVITIRSNVTPFGVLSPITFQQTAPSGSAIPVLAGEKSDKVGLRIYNNYALQSGIAAAINVQITTFDGAGPSSHTALKSVVSQQWLKLFQYGYGESQGTPAPFSYWQSNELAVGGSTFSFFSPDKSSNGVAGTEIRAYTTGSGCGFIELKAYLEVPNEAPSTIITFGLSVEFEWIP